MGLPAGDYRVDVLMLVAYQLLQMYSAQQLFLVLLQYVPPYGCFGDHCVKIEHKCWQDCVNCTNVCANKTDAELSACKDSHHYYFWSPMMEYQVRCRDYYSSFSIAESQYAGVLLGNFFVGYLADRFGRRLVLLGALIIGIPILALSGAIVDILAFYVLRFMLGITIAATMAVGWAYSAEMISPRHRFKLRTFTSWTNGRIIMTLLTFSVRTWRHATFIHAGASLLTLSIITFLPESPMWLKRKGKFERQEKALDRLAWMKGLERKSDKEEKKKAQPPRTMSFFDMLQDSELRTNFFVLLVMWFCSGLSMYCIDLNGEDMTENLWVGQFMAAILASVIRVIFGFADDKLPWLGRRLVYIISMSTCIIASAALLFENINEMKPVDSRLTNIAHPVRRCPAPSSPPSTTVCEIIAFVPMQMTDDQGASHVSVRTLRDELARKLSVSQQNDVSQSLSGNAVPVLPHLRSSQPPPVPPHRRVSPQQTPPLRTRSKPPLAPKPPHISRQNRKPTIFISDSDQVANSLQPYVNMNVVEPPTPAAECTASEDFSTRPSRDIQRPKSTVSTTSTENGDAAEISDSDSDDGRRNEDNLMHRADSYLSGPAQLSLRRPSALCFNGDPTLHDKIVDELKRQGIIRSSDRMMKKREKTASAAEAHGGRSSLLSSDCSMQSDSSLQKTPSNGAAFNVSTSTDKLVNTVSSRSSTVTTTSAEFETVPDYNTGDPDEDKRLKKLHYAANEFYSVQKMFLKYLRDMGEVYPEYVTEFGKRLGKDLLSRQGAQPHVVRQLQLHFEQLIRFHKLLLDEFSSRLDNWTSLEPNMADIIIKYADFLKICKPFLLDKSRFVQELTQLRLENKDFDNATVAFEQKIFNRGVGAVVQQLDQVHQNFMRYKILMMSYNNYLVKGSEEQKKTLEAITKLEKIAQSVNESMGLPSNEELFKLYDRFQCHFDVFYPGRRLIRQGEVLKQTRKEPQPRYLVLFSDTLWICRVMSGFGSSGLFDMGRSYRLPIETVRTESNPHEDYEQQLYVKSKYKSLILIMSSARERSQWQKDIDNAREEKRKYKRRMSQAIERQRRQSLNPLMLEAPLNESGVEEPSDDTTATIIDTNATLTNGDQLRHGPPLITSRRNSDSQESSSHPSTPVDDLPGPSTSGLVHSKRKILRSDTVKPLWIPDDSSSKCLMEGCDTVFSFLNRRHHCRDCGWLICSDCVGKAPLLKFHFKKEIVCPECYDKLEGLYNAGTLFPTTILLRGSDGIVRIRVPKGATLHEKKFVVVEPQTLFTPPVNRGLKRMNIEERMTQENGLVFGKVMVRNAKGGETVRHAQLSDGMVLKFFKAPFDDDPCDQYVIYGFELKETELEAGGTQFELTHRNQILTDRKEHVISFRVEHEKSILKWSTALRQGLGLE